MHSNRQGSEHGMRPDERKKKTMKEYFAYGSNLNLGQMARRCPESFTVQTARLEGCLRTGVPREPVLEALDRCRGEAQQCPSPEKCSKQQISGR